MTEGDTVTVMYAILSNISLVGDTDFATFNIEVLQGSGSATGKKWRLCASLLGQIINQYSSVRI